MSIMEVVATQTGHYLILSAPQPCISRPLSSLLECVYLIDHLESLLLLAYQSQTAQCHHYVAENEVITKKQNDQGPLGL